MFSAMGMDKMVVVLWVCCIVYTELKTIIQSYLNII